MKAISEKAGFRTPGPSASSFYTPEAVVSFIHPNGANIDSIHWIRDTRMTARDGLYWCSLLAPAPSPVSMRQHTSACVSIRQHTSAY